MIQLPDISTDPGVLSRLIIAECENPGYADYNQADGRLSFRMMQAVVVNRLNNHPSQFSAPGATNLTDIITAPGQFEGFSMSGGAVQISAAVSNRIATVMTNANAGDPGPYYQFVQDIVTCVNGPVSDPLGGVTSINGTAVQGGVYGWRTVGSGDPGGSFFPIPAALAGIVLGNQFYTLLAADAVGAEIHELESQLDRARFDGGVSLLTFLKASGVRGGRTSIEGYVARTETDEFLLFSRMPGSGSWVRIRTRDIQQAEYFGNELRDGVFHAKVRLTL
jgi:hypothetical protein